MTHAAEFDDELLSAYLDGELTPDERARVEARLAEDPRARQLLEELRGISQTLQSLPPATLGADLRETVLRRAERAMLVADDARPEPPAPIAGGGGLSELLRHLPLGRSRRSWFWAGAALAAGLMLMVLNRDPAADRGLPTTVAARGDRADGLKEPLPNLSMRALETSAAAPGEGPTDQDSAIGHIAVEDRVSAKDKAAVAESAAPPAERDRKLATADGGVASTVQQVEESGLVAAPAAPAVASRTPFGGGAGGGAVGAIAAQDDSAAIVVEPPVAAEELVVVHVNMKPEALRNRLFDAVLLKNSIEVAEPAAESSAPPPADVDLVLVQAEPKNVYACLAELDRDSDQYLGVVVDEQFAASQQSQAAADSARSLIKYNRGGYAPQQQLARGTGDRLYYRSNRAQQPAASAAPATSSSEPSRYFGAAPLQDAENRAVRLQPQSGAAGEPAAEGKVHSSLEAATTSAAVPGESAFDNARQSMVRRGVQKLAHKAEMLQVLFVLSAEAPSAAAPTAEPVVSERGGSEPAAVEVESPAKAPAATTAPATSPAAGDSVR